MYFVLTCVCHIDNRFKSKREIDHFFFFGTDKNTNNWRRWEIAKKKYWVVFEEQTVSISRIGIILQSRCTCFTQNTQILGNEIYYFNLNSMLIRHIIFGQDYLEGKENYLSRFFLIFPAVTKSKSLSCKFNLESLTGRYVRLFIWLTGRLKPHIMKRNYIILK